MLPQETIRKKRDGEELSAAAISEFIAGMTVGTITEGQAAAFAMAVYFKGMSRAETVALTLAMRDSGDVLDWSDAGRPIVDKHSTGGIGDNVSLMLAPILAACGAAVPMISGRGLGHTGGTLDKLESIPGYQIRPDAQRLRETVRNVGCAIIGPTGDLAPADRILYGIRDVTATVDSMPLICASILSKKLAAGLETLVLDVKFGSGAFMTTVTEAEELARILAGVANDAGVRTSALITDMNEPLADAAGNALEIANCLAFLKGEKKGTRLEAIVFALAGQMLMQSGIASGPTEAETMARTVLENGQAAETFARMVSALGGPADLLERSSAYLPEAAVILPVPASADGFLSACNARDVGLAVIGLGGGRRKPSDAIDHAVGFSRLVPLGTQVRRGDPIAFVHARNASEAEAARAELSECYRISAERPDERPVIAGLV
ncbi:thymidine phosphorylase [Rhizobium sp. PAMB 3174]